MRKGDKRVLNELANTPNVIRYNNKTKGNAENEGVSIKIKLVQESWQKAFILIQAAVSKVNITDFTLRVEQSEVCTILQSYLSAMLLSCLNVRRLWTN